jgi:3-hydroxy-9,10-secoandrosta-1,3,5(10)-triene-9,17-dione monooxygenase
MDRASEASRGDEPHPEVALARELAVWLEQQAERIERDGRIPDDVAQRLTAAGLFRLTLPPRYGGMGVEPRIAWEATMAIAAGCGSCAWVHGLGSANVLMIGKFPKQAQDEVFGGGRPAIVPMLTGGVGHDIRTEPRPGGVMLSGRWRYASGIDVASWVGLLVPLPAVEPDAEGEPHVVLVPREAFSIDHGSWRVLGMRGTGSKDIALAPTFVPEHRWMRWSTLQAGERHPDCPNPERVYDFPLTTVFAMSVLAPTLGVASAVVDEYARIVRHRVASGTREHAIGDKITQVALAQARAEIDLLIQVLLADSDMVMRRVADGAALTMRERASLRMKFAVAARRALQTCQQLFASLGGSLLPSGSRIERQFRDLHAMCSHFLLQPEPIGEAYGRLMLGLELPPTARL